MRNAVAEDHWINLVATNYFTGIRIYGEAVFLLGLGQLFDEFMFVAGNPRAPIMNGNIDFRIKK